MDGREPPVPRRRRLAPRERTAQVIEAAAPLFAEKRPDEVTAGEVADRAHISRASFYRLFSSVDEVFERVLGGVADSFAARLRVGGSADHAEEVRRLTVDFLRTARTVRPGALAALRAAKPASVESPTSVVGTVRREIVDEILRRSCPEESGPLARRTVQTWLAGAEVQVIAWLETGDAPPEPLADLLAVQLVALIEATARVTGDASLGAMLRSIEESRGL